MVNFSANFYDVVIVGSGAAGLALALQLADGAKIAIITKESLTSGASQHAQGGIACAWDPDDSPAAHIEDTLRAGAGLCDPITVNYTLQHAKSALEWLIHQGLSFTKETQPSLHYHLTQEGGHSKRRILHVADKTGAAVIQTLLHQLLKHPNIHCLTHHMVIDLLTENEQCIGLYALDTANQTIFTLSAHHVVLATGGASYLYRYNSNPSRTSGDGIAMAYRAGAVVANLEFTQFHPTCLYNPQGKRYLITEVIRGEGGHLLLPNGERFMLRYDPRAEMAPRDLVSRAIHEELKKRNLPCVYLDISHRPFHFVKNTFPTIWEQCLKEGFDITKEPIPVIPAAHYTCGGVLTNLNGQTNIKNLYAIGETAYTGLHGANRMASNSLLECLVFATSCAKTIRGQKTMTVIPHPPIVTGGTEKNLPILALTEKIQSLMWDNVGIVRNAKELLTALTVLEEILLKVESGWATQRLSLGLLELRNLATVALLTTKSALLREESRGTHYRSDFPTPHAVSRNLLLRQHSSTFTIPIVEWAHTPALQGSLTLLAD